MVDISKKIIKEFGRIMDRHMMGKEWKVVTYDDDGTILGKSNLFKFTKKKLVWSAPRLTFSVIKTGHVISTFLVSGRGRWDITKKVRWDSLFQNGGVEAFIDDFNISLPEVWL